MIKSFRSDFLASIVTSDVWERRPRISDKSQWSSKFLSRWTRLGVIFSVNVSSHQSRRRSRAVKVSERRNSSMKSYSVPQYVRGVSFLSDFSHCFDFCGGNLKNSRNSSLNDCFVVIIPKVSSLSFVRRSFIDANLPKVSLQVVSTTYAK